MNPFILTPPPRYDDVYWEAMHAMTTKEGLKQLSDYLDHTQNGYDAIIEEICAAARALASSCGHAVGCRFSSCTCGAVEARHAALTEMNHILRKYGKNVST